MSSFFYETNKYDLVFFFHFDLVILTEYLTDTVTVVSSNSFVGPSPRTKFSL